MEYQSDLLSCMKTKLRLTVYEFKYIVNMWL